MSGYDYYDESDSYGYDSSGVPKPAPAAKAKKAPAKKPLSDSSSDEAAEGGMDRPGLVPPTAPYGGSAVLQKIMARKAKWQFLNKGGSTMGAAGKSKEDTKSKKSKSSKKGDTDGVTCSRLERTDMGYREMHAHFMSHQPLFSNVEVETILDVTNPNTWEDFDKYRTSVAKKRPYLVRNNLLTKRMYHGTFLRCDLGLDDNMNPCKHPDCRVCQILRKGFRLAKFGTGARKPEDAKDCDKHARFGKGIYFSDWASKAQEYSTAYATKAGKRGRTAILACQVVVGKSQPLWAYDGKRKAPDKEYDSVHGELANVDHPDAPLQAPETVVYSDHAAVVTQIFIYSHPSPMCPACGIAVDKQVDVATPQVRDEYGWFCSEGCHTLFKEETEEFEATVRDTPLDLDEPGFMPFWDKTNSEENCDLVPLWNGSKEGTILQQKFKKTMPNATILKMFRVQNHFLHERYVQECQRVVARTGNAANETLVFHGTSDTAPDEIYDTDEGFDFRFCSWGMWGKGTYFAVNASYSNGYAYTEPSGYKTMFLAKVCLGDTVELQPDSGLTMPPEKPVDPSKTKKGKRPKRERYDSVTGNTGGSKVHIVYASAKSYPAYLITYSEGPLFRIIW